MKSEWDDLDHLKRNLERALKDIYRLYRLPFLGWLRKGWSSLVAEDHVDIFQDTVIQTWENVDSGRLEILHSSLWTYMCGIGKNIARAFWRKNKNLQYFDNMSDYLAEIDPDTEREKLSEEELANIWLHIDQMPEPNRSILTLTFKYGMTSAEIAEVMNYNSENGATGVRVQRYRALNQLKNAIEL